MQVFSGQSNYHTFINLITVEGNKEHIEKYIVKVKEVEDYDEGFKLFNVYKRSYKERLNYFIEEYNGHTDELKFITKELEQLNFIKLYPFSINCELKDGYDEIYNKILSLWPFEISREYPEYIADEYFDILIDLFLFLHGQQAQIIKFLNEIKDSISKSFLNTVNIFEVDSIDEEIVDPLKDSMADKLRLLYHLGILDYLKDKYDAERTDWGKVLNKIIGHDNSKSVERSVIDFFKDRENEKSKSDFRIGYNQDVIVKYIARLLREK